MPGSVIAPDALAAPKSNDFTQSIHLFSTQVDSFLKKRTQQLLKTNKNMSNAQDGSFVLLMIWYSCC